MLDSEYSGTGMMLCHWFTEVLLLNSQGFELCVVSAVSGNLQAEIWEQAALAGKYFISPRAGCLCVPVAWLGNGGISPSKLLLDTAVLSLALEWLECVHLALPWAVEPNAFAWRSSGEA